MKSPDKNVEDILKYLVLYAFQRGNWQQPIDPLEDKEYREAISAINQLIADKQTNLLKKLIRQALAETTFGVPSVSIQQIEDEIAALNKQVKENEDGQNE